MNADNRLLVLATQMKAIQARMEVMEIEWNALTKKYNSIRLKQIPDLMSEEGIRTVTVSYTHLDVYKRQSTHSAAMP